MTRFGDVGEKLEKGGHQLKGIGEKDCEEIWRKGDFHLQRRKKIRYRMDIQRERASNINMEKEESYR